MVQPDDLTLRHKQSYDLYMTNKENNYYTNKSYRKESR
jgi:hypothetical protein